MNRNPVVSPFPAAPPTDPHRDLSRFRVIQGGMGAGVSSWSMARAVSRRGQIGVVSGTGIDSLLVRHLQDGDRGGHLRRALEHFPLPGIADEILRRWYRPEGERGDAPYKLIPLETKARDIQRQRLLLAANFAEVWLAKEGHDGIVGINLLTKIQRPNLPSLYGAMLAAVDIVLMGAGIPREIPAALDAMADGRPAAIRMDVEGLPADKSPFLTFDPRDHDPTGVATVTRPSFVPIVSSNLLATVLARKATGRIDGFVIEGPTAGGHNAPPRGEPQINDRGEPIYGERDLVDSRKIAALGLPFWLAGGTAWPGCLQQAIESGAAGIQVGTLFAYCRESGIREDIRRIVISRALQGQIDVLTDANASPTGFPFKVVRLEGTLSEQQIYEARVRHCDMGYLRTAYVKPNDGIGFRCPSEPVDQYVAKGGAEAETVGRKCLCNSLMANVGVGQVRKTGEVELPLLTSGDDLKHLGRFLAGRTEYSAADVLTHLLG